MDRNELIGTIIGKTVGYAVQGYVYSEIARVLNPRSVILIKTTSKYAVRVLKYTSKNYARIDYRPETIFSDAVNASFSAD